jgi:hypothetical protein
MTEARWLAGKNPFAMLQFLDGWWEGEEWAKAGERKMRLFACGCCRLCSELLTDERCSDAIELSERFADGTATRDQLKAAARAVQRFTRGDTRKWNRERWAHAAAAYAAQIGFRGRMILIIACATEALEDPSRPTVTPPYVPLLRCIFGNPFRPLAFSPRWRTDTAIALAKQVYESREFGAMPILADALQDAGCEDADILGHCRGPGPHVRGCWVVDLVLGKK